MTNASANNTRIGGQNSAGNQFYTGRIQGVRTYNRVLTPQEIQSLYMEGLRKLGGAGLAPLTDGLVAYYDFNGDANDIIGGNNGTVTGTTLTTDRFGNGNRAYGFNGTTDKIVSTGNAGFSGDAVMSASFWVNVPSL